MKSLMVVRRAAFRPIWLTSVVGLLATTGLALSIAVLPALALATAPTEDQTAPETRPAVDVTSVSATLEGWLGSEQPEAKAHKEGPEREGPGGSKEAVAPADPKMLPASWYFQYTAGRSCTGTGYVTTPEHVAMLEGFDEARVTVTGLQPGTEYTVCLVDWHTVLPGVSFTTVAEGNSPTVTLGGRDSGASPIPVPAHAGPAQLKVTGKALKLAAALKACEKKPKRKRSSCEKRAKKKYASQKRHRRGKR